MTLTEFLLARIAEDEAYNATERIPIPPDRTADGEWATVPGQPRVGSRRVLAECDAKRRIVERYRQFADREYQAETLRLLATPYADHPDYQEEWTS